MKDEIERLRAAAIVDRAVIQAVIESLPAEQRVAVAVKAHQALERFTARTLASTMPEPFAQAQQASAEAWIQVVQSLAIAARP